MIMQIQYTRLRPQMRVRFFHGAATVLSPLLLCKSHALHKQLCLDWLKQSPKWKPDTATHTYSQYLGHVYNG